MKWTTYYIVATVLALTKKEKVYLFVCETVVHSPEKDAGLTVQSLNESLESQYVKKFPTCRPPKLSFRLWQ